jgi:hypothetical protein
VPPVNAHGRLALDPPLPHLVVAVEQQRHHPNQMIRVDYRRITLIG